MNMGTGYELLIVSPSRHLFFSTFGGLGKEATVFYNRLADFLLHKKHSTSYNQTLSWMCYALSFSLLHFAVLTICGSRSPKPTELPAVSTAFSGESCQLALIRTIIVIVANS